MTVTVGWYLALAAVLFTIGGAGVLLRRNALVMFMSIELMLNSVNLTFVAASKSLGLIEGQVAALFVIVVAAAFLLCDGGPSFEIAAPPAPEDSEIAPPSMPRVER